MQRIIVRSGQKDEKWNMKKKCRIVKLTLSSLTVSKYPPH